MDYLLYLCFLFVLAPLVGSLRGGVYIDKGRLVRAYIEKESYSVKEEVVKLLDVIGNPQMEVDTSEVDISHKALNKISCKAKESNRRKEEVIKFPDVIRNSQMEVDTSEVDTSRKGMKELPNEIK